MTLRSDLQAEASSVAARRAVMPPPAERWAHLDGNEQILLVRLYEAGDTGIPAEQEETAFNWLGRFGLAFLWWPPGNPVQTWRISGSGILCVEAQERGRQARLFP